MDLFEYNGKHYITVVGFYSRYFESMSFPILLIVSCYQLSQPKQAHSTCGLSLGTNMIKIGIPSAF